MKYKTQGTCASAIDIEVENGIITFKNDGNEVRLSTYELQDNRKLR